MDVVALARLLPAMLPMDGPVPANPVANEMPCAVCVSPVSGLEVGDVARARARAGQQPFRLAERGVPEVVRILLRPFEPALGAVEHVHRAGALLVVDSIARNADCKVEEPVTVEVAPGGAA